MQLRDASIGRGKIDAAFETSLAQIEANITSIFNTMSTDAERMAAVDALTTAFQNADGTLQGMITSMVNATRAGAGLQSDGTLVLPVGHNFLTGATTLKAAIGLLDAALKTEEGARIAADAALQANITAIVNAGGASAAADLAAETAARIAADAALTTAVNNEVTARTAADTDLQTQITNEVTARTALNTTLSPAIADEASARTAAVSAEATTRAAADTVLQNALDAEALARTTADAGHTAAINAEVTDRIAAVSAEATTRAAADTALSGRVTTLENATASQLTYSKVVTRETPAGVIDGVNAVFEVAFDMVAGTETVYYNGQLMEPGVGNDYTIAGKEITFTFAPVGTDRVRVSYFR
jgi:hypothetical protein